MTERPIIFSTEMVQAILDGRKTQTRRVIKQQPSEGTFEDNVAVLGYFSLSDGTKTGYGFCDESGREYKCPYGMPGDELWVRETWGVLLSTYNWEYGWECEGLCDAKVTRMGFEDEQYSGREKYSVMYKADGYEACEGESWRPSIFMPRWASRIQLVIKDIRVERLQDITEDDAKAEGVGRPRYDWGDGVTFIPTEKTEFSKVWETINAKRGYSWESNPWVWVVEFEVKK